MEFLAGTIFGAALMFVGLLLMAVAGIDPDEWR